MDSLDGAGQKTSVEIPAQPKKVVSASVTLTGALLAIDAPVAATGGAKANSAIADRNGFLLQWADVAERKGVKSLSQTPTAPDAEKIAAEQPDLIVASAAGADSAAAVHDQLSAIAPTIVIDYTNQSWQSVTEHLGRATGHESEATTAIDEVASRADEVKNRVGEPEQPINIVLPLPTGGLNFLTPESAQGNLITAMGWQVAVPDASLAAPNAQGASRNDVKGVAPENVARALTGKSVLAINADGKTSPSQLLTSNPLLAATPAVSSGNLHDLSADTFRIDYYSALKMLDQIEQAYAK